MAPAPGLMTVEEYFRTPVTRRPAELAFGALRVAESPSPRHQSAVGRLFIALDRHVRERQMGEMWVAPLDVVLDGRRALVVQPDLLFISNARDWIVQDRVRGAPDLVIEVLSPNPRIGHTEERVGWFATYGVRECWLLDQDRKTLTVIAFEAGRIAEEVTFAFREGLRSRVLPDLSASLADLLR